MSSNETDDTMPRKRSKPANEDETMTATDETDHDELQADEPKTLVVDYRGVIARPKGQSAVPHERSPMVIYWPENGALELILHPGVNLIDAKLWKHYTAEVDAGLDSKGKPQRGIPQLNAKIKASQIRVITGPPTDEHLLNDLINRTINHDGLEWLLAQEKARTGDDEPRDYIISAIESRAAKAIPVDITPATFQAQVPMVQSPNMRESRYIQPSIAMG